MVEGVGLAWICFPDFGVLSISADFGSADSAGSDSESKQVSDNITSG